MGQELTVSFEILEEQWSLKLERIAAIWCHFRHDFCAHRLRCDAGVGNLRLEICAVNNVSRVSFNSFLDDRTYLRTVASRLSVITSPSSMLCENLDRTAASSTSSLSAGSMRRALYDSSTICRGRKPDLGSRGSEVYARPSRRKLAMRAVAWCISLRRCGFNAIVGHTRTKMFENKRGLSSGYKDRRDS